MTSEAGGGEHLWHESNSPSCLCRDSARINSYRRSLRYLQRHSSPTPRNTSRRLGSAQSAAMRRQSFRLQIRCELESRFHDQSTQARDPPGQWLWLGDLRRCRFAIDPIALTSEPASPARSASVSLVREAVRISRGWIGKGHEVAMIRRAPGASLLVRHFRTKQASQDEIAPFAPDRHSQRYQWRRSCLT